MKNNLENISELIIKSTNVLIIPHIKPDGDCLGSSFALYNALKKMNKNVTVLVEEEIPKVYSFLSGDYKIIDDFKAGSYDIAISLDCSDETRLNKRLDIFNKSPISINIDHHITNTNYADINYIESDASAVGEIIYKLIGIMGVDIDKDIACNLYVAIATDTGGFMYSNTTSQTHLIISELLKIDFSPSLVNRIVFDTVSKGKMLLTKVAVDNLQYYCNNKVALTYIPYKVLSDNNLNYEDIDGLSSIPRSIEGIEIGILLTEIKKGEIKASIRSNDYADVSKLALEFDGGGHSRASGCTIFGSLEYATNIIIKAACKLIT